MKNTEKKESEVVKATSETKKEKKFIAVNPFFDEQKPGNIFRPGDDVSHFSQERLQSAINRGLVKEA